MNDIQAQHELSGPWNFSGECRWRKVQAGPTMLSRENEPFSKPLVQKFQKFQFSTLSIKVLQFKHAGNTMKFQMEIKPWPVSQVVPPHSSIPTIPLGSLIFHALPTAPKIWNTLKSRWWLPIKFHITTNPCSSSSLHLHGWNLIAWIFLVPTPTRN